jgi:hypothetical protein
VFLSHLSNLLYGGVCELHNLVHNCGLVLDTETERERLRGGGSEEIERGERKLEQCTVQHSAALYYSAQLCSVLRYSALCCIALCCIDLYCIVLCCTVLCCIVLNSIV